MGQCPSNSLYHFDDDDVSVEDKGIFKGMSCYAALPLQHILPEKRSARTFLKPHKPDRVQKCILDPSTVYQSLELQADELLARDNAASRPYIEISRGDGAISPRSDAATCPLHAVTVEDDFSTRTSRSPIPDFLSDIAPSEMTTWSTATEPVANLGRPIKSRRKQSNETFSVMNNIMGAHKVATLDSYDDDDDDEDDGNSVLYSQHSQSNHQREASSRNFMDNMAMAGNNLRRIPVERIDRAKQEQARFFDMNGNFFSSWRDRLKEVPMQQRDRYMTALHLKMKAHLGFFYTQQYLQLFPYAPAPPGLSKAKNTKEQVPNLVYDDCETCSSGSTAHSIDYGSVPPSTAVKYSIAGLPFLDLAITGSLGLVARDGHVSQSKRRSGLKQNQKSPDHYIVLMNQRSGVPLAVCALKSTRGNPIVRMFATKPRIPGQRAAATTQKLGLDWSGNFPLYAWAEIVTDSMYPEPVRFSIFMACGSEGRFSSVPCYRAGLDTAKGTPTIKVVGRTDREVQAKGCALIDIELDEDGQKDEDLVFQMKVSQGIDPALIICFTAVLDEVMEKSMRMQIASAMVPQRNRHYYY